MSSFVTDSNSIRALSDNDSNGGRWSQTLQVRKSGHKPQTTKQCTGEPISTRDIELNKYIKASITK